VTNPANGEKATVTGTVTPTTGSAQAISVARGASQTVEFPGVAGLKIAIDVDLLEDQTIAWEPRNCTTPTTPPATTAPPLAQTGASLGGVIGIGAGLLAVGAALIAAFFVLRRRRSAGEPTA